MSMSTHVYGFIPPDDQWIKMKRIYDSCLEAKVTIPKEVNEFFNWDKPDDDGVTVSLENEKCCTYWSDDMRQGYQIDLTKLPKNIKIIRFVNSW